MSAANAVISCLAVLALLWFLGNALRDVFRDAAWNLNRRMDDELRRIEHNE